MPTKGMRSISFKTSSPSSSSSPSPSPSISIPPSSSHHHSFSNSLVMEENIEIAQFLIHKWDSDASNSLCSITSLFSFDNRQEAKQYLNAVNYLQSAMQHFIKEDTKSEKLVQAHNLMQIAMKRLEKEFYQILSSNRDHLDPESVSNRSSTARSSVSDFDEECSIDEFRVAGDSITETERVSMIAMADLKAIADCMIFSGYGKECVKIYKVMRKSIVDEALYYLGVERLRFSQVQKMDWEVLELKIKKWLNAVKVAVRTLFYGERILCDHVFSTSETIKGSCFAEISKEGAMYLFGFAENVAKCKKTPEKMFRTLDLYESISDLWPEIESIFSFESTSTVRSQAVTSVVKLGEAVRTMLVDFESAIQKDASKTPVPGGGVHPLTRYVMNYISVLADYGGILTDIVADWPLKIQSPLPAESYLGSPYPEDEPSSVISIRLAWLILVLLCKLDGKVKLYKDVALSYLFLANNLQYVVNKVRNSNIKFLVGDDWVTKHESKVKQYVSNYERMGWSKVIMSLPENPSASMLPEKAKDFFKRFNAAFEEACQKQSSWVVQDQKLRDEIKISVAKRIIPTYQEFYETHRVGFIRIMGSDPVVRYAPDDLGNHLSDILYGSGASGSVSSSNSSSTQSRSRRGS
ncbi:Exocyst subunit Exo70 family protein [Quillaja saponaria]|uniref:Exocyst subunit Exo70 family protein n=1 Tax=Quillaja saponaria TaxID=32244 RepID=A0AAD7QG71_QUISA|nr:Exocyst subunit Exo70 family protein [Quillaja saponaria]